MDSPTAQPRTFANFDLEDWVAAYPPWSGPAAQCIDRRVLAASACVACGAAGLEYHPYHHRADRRYRAIARCPRCGHCEEY